MALTPEELKEQIRLAKEHAETLDKVTTAQERLRASAIETLAALERQQAAVEGQAYSAEKAIAQQEIKLGIERQHLELLRAADAPNQAAINAQRLLVDQLERGTNALKESVKAAGDLGKGLSGAFKLSGIGGFSEKLTGVVSALRGGSAGAFEFLNTLSSGVFTAVIDNMAGLVVSLVDTESAFRKSTGASKAYARGVTETYGATRLYGVSAEEASAATMSLYRSFTDFTLSSRRVRAELAETASVLGELGVSNEAFAQTTQIATKMLGVSAGQMRNTSREIATYAQEMNMDIGQMFQQLGQAGPQLAKYGNQGIDTFKRLQHVFKITGLEMNKVLQMTSRFDTFEGAAKQAGMLNAALGSNMVNAMSLMQETDPVARFQMLRNAILDTGLTFDKMSYYQKNFYKDALGLSDVGDLAMMLSGDMRNLAGATQRTSQEWAVFKHQAQQVQSLQEQFQALIASLTPMLTTFMGVIKGIANWLSKHPAVLKTVIGLLVTFKVVMTAVAIKATLMQAGLMAGAGGMAAVGAAAPAAAAGGVALSNAITMVGLAATGSMLGIGLITAAFTAMAVALLAVVPAAASLGNVFSLFGNAENFTTAVAGIKAIKAELTDMPDGTLELTQAMNSVAVAAQAADQSAALINMISQLSAGGLGGGAGGGGPVHGTIDVRFNNEMFEANVVDIIGGKVTDLYTKLRGKQGH